MLFYFHGCYIIVDETKVKINCKAYVTAGIENLLAEKSLQMWLIPYGIKITRIWTGYLSLARDRQSFLLSLPSRFNKCFINVQSNITDQLVLY